MDTQVDLGRMHNYRRNRLQAGMAANDIEVMFLLGFSNQTYAGISQPLGDAGRLHAEPVVVALRAKSLTATVWTNFPEGVASFGRDDVRPGLAMETPAGLEALREFVRSEAAGATRIAVDELTGVMVDAWDSLFDGAEMVDAAMITAPARMIKNTDEIECLRRAQRITEHAAGVTQEMLRPGCRLHELSSRFYKEAHDAGVSVFIEPMWSVIQPVGENSPSIAAGMGYPSPPSNRILREGDLIVTDGGVTWHGYHSDWGKTFVCGNPPTVTTGQQALFDEWSEVIEAVYGAIRPGATAADLVRAADEVSKQYTLPNLYLAHGMGLDAFEPPFVGSDLGIEYDESVVLAPGMVLVLEPVIVREGLGAYRSEEVVVVTEDGYERLSTAGHAPFGA